MPRVTVVVPCHNGEAFIIGAIQSVLAQSFQDLEVVVADDASRDPSPDPPGPSNLDHSSFANPCP